MEQKMITIPFEVEKAKKIQAGEEPGKIVTRAGRNARVVCWDRHDDTYPIIALLWNEERSNEVCKSYMNNGCFFENGEECQHDLTLQVPELTQLRNGDVIYCDTTDGRGDRYIWLAIVKKLFYQVPDRISIDFYFAIDIEGKDKGKGDFDGLGHYADSVRLATGEEKQQLIDVLKASTDPRGKEYLKRFFGIEEKQEQKFEFLQPVLVRDGKGDSWKYGEFIFEGAGVYYVNGGISWVSCIPYNEQTKHLLGTTDDWEE